MVLSATLVSSEVCRCTTCFPVRIATAAVATDTCWLVACRVQRMIDVGWDPYLRNQSRSGGIADGCSRSLGRIP